MPTATFISDPNTGIFASGTERKGYRGVLIAIQSYRRMHHSAGKESFPFYSQAYHRLYSLRQIHHQVVFANLTGLVFKLD